MSSKKLNGRQEAFAEHYAINGSLTEAYKAAGYSTRGNPDTINRKAIAVMQRPGVAERVAELQARIRARAEAKFDLTVDKVLSQYINIAFCDPADFFTWDEKGVTIRPSEELTPAQRSIVTHVQQRRGQTQTIEVKLADRMAALNALAKHLGVFEVDNAQRAAAAAYMVIEDDAV